MNLGTNGSPDRVCDSNWRGRVSFALAALTGVLGLLCFVFVVRRETPEQALAFVDRKWAEGTGLFTPEFMGVCSNVAKRHGTKLLAPIMDRSKSWKGEEGILYMPIIIHLPREETVSILKEFEAGKNEQQRVWSRDFQDVWDFAQIEKLVRSGETSHR